MMLDRRSSPAPFRSLQRRDPELSLPGHQQFETLQPACWPAGRWWRLRGWLALPLDLLALGFRKFADRIAKGADWMAGQDLGEVRVARGWRYDAEIAAWCYVGLPENDPERLACFDYLTRRRPEMMGSLAPELQAAIRSRRATGAA
ncbi:MAG: hypothetical protein ACO1OK_10335 [Devosia sp.]